MAWVRTSLSLISFGFGIAKFFQVLEETRGTQVPAMVPRVLGLVMIVVGLVFLVAAYVHHRRSLTSLRQNHPHLPFSGAGAIALAIILLGVLAFVGVLL